MKLSWFAHHPFLNVRWLSWWTNRLLRRCGFIVLLAMVIILASLFTYSMLHQKQLNEQDSLRDKLKTLTTKLNALPSLPQVQTIDDPFDLWLLQLQSKDELPSTLQSMLNMAQQQGVPLNQGQYQLSKPSVTSGNVVMYTLRFSLTATYPQLRRWIHAVMQTLPSVSLETLRISRNERTQQELEVEMVWVIYLRGERLYAH